jgi:hypothetical protein
VALLAAAAAPNNGLDTPGERRDSLAASATSPAGAPGPRRAAVTVDSDSPWLYHSDPHEALENAESDIEQPLATFALPGRATIDLGYQERIVGGQKWLYDLTPAASKIEFPASADEQRNQFVASFPAESASPEASSVEPAGGSPHSVLGTVPGEPLLTEAGGLARPALSDAGTVPGGTSHEFILAL